MRKIIAFLMLCTILIVGCTEGPAHLDKWTAPRDLSACNSDSDCVVVTGKSCCSCRIVINKQYQELWNIQPFIPCSIPNRECEVCPSMSDEAKCVNNNCQQA